MSDFQEFMRQRIEAAEAYVGGDPGPLGRISARELPATFFGPRGDVRSGADEVWSTYERDAGAFQPDGRTTLDVLDQAAGEDVGYWVGVQRARVRFGLNEEPVDMTLRVTELFRREHGEWKLVHRHADPLREAV